MFEIVCLLDIAPPFCSTLAKIARKDHPALSLEASPRYTMVLKMRLRNKHFYTLKDVYIKSDAFTTCFIRHRPDNVFPHGLDYN